MSFKMGFRITRGSLQVRIYENGLVWPVVQEGNLQVKEEAEKREGSFHKDLIKIPQGNKTCGVGFLCASFKHQCPVSLHPLKHA